VTCFCKFYGTLTFFFLSGSQNIAAPNGCVADYHRLAADTTAATTATLCNLTRGPCSFCGPLCQTIRQQEQQYSLKNKILAMIILVLSIF